MRNQCRTHGSRVYARKQSRAFSRFTHSLTYLRGFRRVRHAPEAVQGIRRPWPGRGCGRPGRNANETTTGQHRRFLAGSSCRSTRSVSADATGPRSVYECRPRSGPNLAPTRHRRVFPHLTRPSCFLPHRKGPYPGPKSPELERSCTTLRTSYRICASLVSVEVRDRLSDNRNVVLE